MRRIGRGILLLNSPIRAFKNCHIIGTSLPDHFHQFAVGGDGALYCGIVRGCPETKSLEDNILCHVLGKTKSRITG
jgi:hypothetical protein